MIKSIAKAVLPARLVRWLGEGLNRRRASRLAHLPIEQAFDEIYRKRLWAPAGGPLSGEGSAGRAAEGYLSFLEGFIREHSIATITDVGCGDFSIGSRICHKVERYVGLDVSAEIIRQNRARYMHLSNVEFRQCNACVEALPAADLVTVRQVLQHLSNDQIEAMLRNIERSGSRFAIVSEHLPSVTQFKQPNRDLPGHSAEIRTWLNSGVDISRPPFMRRAELLFEMPFDDREDSDRFAVFVWPLSPT